MFKSFNLFRVLRTAAVMRGPTVKVGRNNALLLLASGTACYYMTDLVKRQRLAECAGNPGFRDKNLDWIN